jgi:carbamoyl-phosphate synthase small subunit
MTDRPTGYLVLADGSVFEGELAGAIPETSVAGEVVFNTSMTGYQEILTDPSYAGQFVVFTTAHLGNYGTNPVDDESSRVWCGAAIMGDLADRASNYRSTEDLDAFALRHGCTILCGVDTRRLTRHLRDHGALPGVIGSGPLEALKDAAASAHGTDAQDLATVVSTDVAYELPGGPHRLVVVDFGVKVTMLRQLQSFAHLTVVPATTSAEEIRSLNPTGLFLSNGPGDPAALGSPVEMIGDLLGELPIFGICLGHQLLSRALGATTYKLPFGHHGGNHPVVDLATGHVEITAQNHNYAVDGDSLRDVLVTHRNLNDGVIEGISALERKAFSVQYHPEAGPGPHDARYLFHRFTTLLEGGLHATAS